jgi:hypothetical protein
MIEQPISVPILHVSVILQPLSGKRTTRFHCWDSGNRWNSSFYKKPSANNMSITLASGMGVDDYFTYIEVGCRAARSRMFLQAKI